MGISQLRRGFLAEYEAGVRLVIVTEESAASAGRVMEALRNRWAENHAPLGLGEEGLEATDRYLGSLCIFRKGAVIAGGVGKDRAVLGEAVRELAKHLP